VYCVREGDHGMSENLDYDYWLMGGYSKAIGGPYEEEINPDEEEEK
jgi:hypothetical protein